MKMTDDLADQLRNKLRGIISGYKINEDDAGWLEGLIAARLAADQQKGGGEVWRCFHCDETFTDVESATEHFGTRIRHDPACTLDPAEFRRLEDTLAEYADEDAAVHRAMRRMETEHRMALEREEIKGYERGLRDSGKCPCAAPQPSIPASAQQCWSCGETYTPEQRSAADGNCPACGVEIELFAQQDDKASGGEVDDAMVKRAKVAYNAACDAGWQPCPNCKGTRRERDNYTECGTCEGAGWKWDESAPGPMRAALTAALAHPPHADQETQG